MKISDGSVLFDDADVAQLGDAAIKALNYEASRYTDKKASDILSGAVNNFIFSVIQQKEQADLNAAKEGLKAFFKASPDVKAKIADMLGVAVIPDEPTSVN